MKDIFFKQLKLFNPETEQRRIHIYGAGSIGSHLAMGLAKTGFNDLTVYDYDDVEDSNIPAQFFDLRCIGKPKTDSVWSLIREFTGIEIATKNIEIDEEFVPDLSVDSIHIVCFDNIEGRKLLYEKLVGYQLLFIDGRIGGFNYQLYTNRMEQDTSDYAKTLEGVFSELECGEKCLWGINSLLSSKIIAQILRKIKGKALNTTIKGNLLTETVIQKME